MTAAISRPSRLARTDLVAADILDLADLNGHAVAAKPDIFGTDAELDRAAGGLRQRPAASMRCEPSRAVLPSIATGMTFMPGEPMK